MLIQDLLERLAQLRVVLSHSRRAHRSHGPNKQQTIAVPTEPTRQQSLASSHPRRLCSNVHMPTQTARSARQDDQTRLLSSL